MGVMHATTSFRVGGSDGGKGISVTTQAAAGHASASTSDKLPAAFQPLARAADRSAAEQLRRRRDSPTNRQRAASHVSNTLSVSTAASPRGPPEPTFTSSMTAQVLQGLQTSMHRQVLQKMDHKEELRKAKTATWKADMRSYFRKTNADLVHTSGSCTLIRCHSHACSLLTWCPFLLSSAHTHTHTNSTITSRVTMSKSKR